MKFGKSGMRPDWEYKLGNDSLQESEKEKKSGNSCKQQTVTRRAYSGESKEYA